MLLLLKFVMFFWANLIYGNVMLYMSLGLRTFSMVSCPLQMLSHFHEDDGRYPTTIHQYFCSGVSG
jgi:hypothetical protein